MVASCVADALASQKPPGKNSELATLLSFQGGWGAFSTLQNRLSAFQRQALQATIATFSIENKWKTHTHRPHKLRCTKVVVSGSNIPGLS